MAIKRHTQITIETHSLTIIKTRFGSKINLVYCRHCRANVATFRHARAALIFRAEPSEIERLSQIDSIHAAEDAALCGNSLAGFFNRQIRYVKD